MPLIFCEIDMGVVDQKIIYFDEKGQVEYRAKTYELISTIDEILKKYNMNEVRLSGPKEFIEPIVEELEEKGIMVK